MSLILGMDGWVFAAWLLTIISAILCVLYGIYHQFIKKSNENEKNAKKKIKKKIEEDE
ncbi:MAG: hypothetical protein JXA91_01375 [Candidatus Thermoplasmatota archaeon]|nr:hypothetical protein [Candidatus Thermoplasmatota archaeon]